MRCISIFGLVILAALPSLGCKPEDGPKTAADAKVSEAKEKIKAAAEAAAKAAAAKRDEYAVEMRKQLDELDAKSAVLKEKASKAAGQAKADLEKKLEETKSKHADAVKKLEELKNASAEHWESFKEGMKKAYEDVKKSID